MPDQFHTPILLQVPLTDSYRTAVESFLSDPRYRNMFPHLNDTASQLLFWINETADSILIEQVRQLQHTLAYTQPDHTLAIHILLHADKMTVPAQQAMLKTLEEPPNNTQLILSVDSVTQLLPTIVSRCIPIILSSAQHFNETTQNEAVKKVVCLGSYSDAINLAQEYKDKDAALTLLKQLISQLHLKLKQEQGESLLQLIRCMKKCQATYLAIAANTNVLLALEQCFFEFVDSNK